MHMKFASGILRYEPLVLMRDGGTENHFDSDSAKNKNKIWANKKTC